MSPAAASDGLHVWRFDAIGTVWRVETADKTDAATRAAVSALIAGFDAEWSRFRPDSLVSRLAGGGSAVAPVDAAAMLDAYAQLSDATAGAVNPLIGDALARRGYDSAYTLVNRGAAAAPARWRDIVRWTDDALSLSAPGVIDVGALGKGRLVDRMADLLVDHGHGVGHLGPGHGGFVVDGGGDIRVLGVPQRIGLEHPYDHRRAIGVWTVADGALCASAVNRRTWGDGLHHVLDARTGEPVRTIAATWAVAASAMAADAIATALFFDGGPALARAWGVEWVRMTTDGRVEWSPASEAELFL